MFAAEPELRRGEQPIDDHVMVLDAIVHELGATLRADHPERLSNRFQARPPFAANPDPLAAKGIRGMRARDNQDENAPPPSRRREA